MPRAKKVPSVPPPFKAPVEPNDLLAGADVCARLNECWDQLDLDQTIPLLEASEVLLAQVKSLVGNLRMQAVNQIEQPRVVAGKTWSKVRSFKSRPRHNEIQKRVVDVATGHTDEGEVLDKDDAVKLAVRLMAEMFVSPSTEPKVGGLKQIGFKGGVKGISDEEFTGWDLVRADIKSDV